MVSKWNSERGDKHVELFGRFRSRFHEVSPASFCVTSRDYAVGGNLDNFQSDAHWRASRRRVATSSESEVNGICPARTYIPLRWRAGMTFFQLDASAYAGCTRATVATGSLGFGHCALWAKSEIGRPTNSACPITPLRKRPRWNVLAATADSGSTK